VHYLPIVGCVVCAGGFAGGSEGDGGVKKCEPIQIVPLPMIPHKQFLICSVGKLAVIVIVPSHSTNRNDSFGLEAMMFRFKSVYLH
jgi:hypothetical protein